MSAGLPAEASAADLQFALQSLEEVGRVSVTREGSCAGFSWSIKWTSTFGKQHLLQVPPFVSVSVFFCVLHAYVHLASLQKELETLSLKMPSKGWKLRR